MTAGGRLGGALLNACTVSLAHGAPFDLASHCVAIDMVVVGSYKDTCQDVSSSMLL